MRKILFAAALLAASLSPMPGTAQSHCITDIRGNQVCGTRAGQCALDRYNNAWCAPDNGTAMKDRYDEVVCGAGVCVKDGRSGEIFCTRTAGGTTTTDVGGNTSCEGGCVPASKSACRRMTPN